MILLGRKMEVRWTEKNIHPSTIVKLISKFLKEKNFDVSIVEGESKFTVIATPKRGQEISEEIKILVKGKPDDFIVDFSSGKHSKNLIFLGSLTSFLGGGFLGLKGLKSKENIEKLERSFWKFLTSEISNMA